MITLEANCPEATSKIAETVLLFPAISTKFGIEASNLISPDRVNNLCAKETLANTSATKTKIYLTSNGSKVGATGNFSVHAQDYGIEIPSLVKEKFAEQIKVSFDFDLDTK